MWVSRLSWYIGTKAPKDIRIWFDDQWKAGKVIGGSGSTYLASRTLNGLELRTVQNGSWTICSCTQMSFRTAHDGSGIGSERRMQFTEICFHKGWALTMDELPLPNRLGITSPNHLMRRTCKMKYFFCTSPSPEMTPRYPFFVLWAPGITWARLVLHITLPEWVRFVPFQTNLPSASKGNFERLKEFSWFYLSFKIRFKHVWKRNPAPPKADCFITFHIVFWHTFCYKRHSWRQKARMSNMRQKFLEDRSK